MNFLNCIGKLVKKIVVEKLSRFCKINLKLYKNQIKAQKSRSTIDTIVIIVDNIYKIWKEKTIAILLWIDVKEAFDNISQVKFAQ